jgi:uncharacterized protein with HEPN domain
VTGSGRDRRYLTYVLESIVLVEHYTRDGREAFLSDPMVQDAVLRRLETLAEATGRLSDELKARRATIPWRAVQGFRNVAAHAYLDVELGDVWDIVVGDLPAMRAAVEAELARIDD